MGVTTSPKNATEALYINNNNNNILNDMNSDMTLKNIGEFYKGAKILITGATGFVGKALLEKLLRSCSDLDTVYLLLRPKRGMRTDQRLNELMKSPIFNKIKEKDPNLINKVKIVEGDVSMDNLGLSDADREKLVENVDIVFHSAASIRFNETLKDAVILNTLGTFMMIELSSKMKNLRSFVHVSTAYSNADKRIIEEVVYKPPCEPYTIMNCIRNLPDDAINTLATKLLGEHPNTYTFTKAMAEYLVSEHSAQLPCCIVRPSIVLGAWKEPYPGWVDSITGVTGVSMEIGRGNIKTILGKEDQKMDAIPIDIVVNTIITGAWHTVANRSNTIRVYNCTSGNINGINWAQYGKLITTYSIMYPSKYITWYPGFSYRTNRVMHWVYRLLFQRVPACVFDLVLLCTRRKPVMYKTAKKFAKACDAGEFCALNEWDFKNGNLLGLIKDVKSAEDGKNFDLDISEENGFTWESYVHDFILGIRKYVLKDDLSSLPSAKTKLNRFYWAGKCLQIATMYLILKLTVL